MGDRWTTAHDPRHRRQCHQEGNQLERSGCSQDTPLAARTPRQLRPSGRDSSCGPYWSPLLASLAKRPADTPPLPGHLHALLAITLERMPPALPSTRNRPRTAVQGCVLRPLCAAGRRGNRERIRQPTSVSAVQPSAVGLAGLEPAASSLSAIGGLPLCNPAFLQVKRVRKGRSNAF